MHFFVYVLCLCRDQSLTLLIPQAPIALDALGSYVLVAFAPLELTLLRVVMTGALSPTGTPTAKIHAVRELSIMSVGQPITVRGTTYITAVAVAVARSAFACMQLIGCRLTE